MDQNLAGVLDFAASVKEFKICKLTVACLFRHGVPQLTGLYTIPNEDSQGTPQAGVSHHYDCPTSQRSDSCSGAYSLGAGSCSAAVSDKAAQVFVGGCWSELQIAARDAIPTPMLAMIIQLT